jgi:hypothetical protein
LILGVWIKERLDKKRAAASTPPGDEATGG